MTLAESLLALTVYFMAAAVLLPFWMAVTEGTSERWQQQEGMRKLYEEAESRLLGEAEFVYALESKTFKGDIEWHEESGKSKACVQTKASRLCVEQQ